MRQFRRKRPNPTRPSGAQKNAAGMLIRASPSRMGASRGPQTQKRARRGAPFGIENSAVSAFRELERTPRLGPAVFLALDHAAVARQEAAALERATQVRLEIGQC